MDWYVIEYLYPRAFNRFIQTMFPNVGVLSISSLEYYDPKKLYKFFDKEGIYLNVEMYTPSQWVYTVSLNNGVCFGQTQMSKNSRDEVECDGFTDCFKILEKRYNEEL